MLRVLRNSASSATASSFGCIVLLALVLPLVVADAADGRIGNVSIFERVDDETELSGELKPVEMVGARNGWASGQVLLLSESSRDAIEVKPGPLEGPDGARIPADRVWVRYGWNREPHQIEGDDRELDEYIILADAPPEQFTRLPIWFTVKIPADAQPGHYTGEVEVQSEGHSDTVTLDLRVGAYRLPDRRDYRSFNNITYSPDSVALRYDVEPWSEAHLDLQRRSLEWLAEAGQRVFYVTFAERTQFGTRTPLIRFTREGSGLKPDLEPLRRFSALWDEIIGPPRAAVLYLWDIDMRRGRGDNEVDDIRVNVVEADGSTRFIEVPHISTPEGNDFWKPVVDEIIDSLVDLGWSEDRIFFGIAHDRKPTERFTRATAELFPGMKWNVISHQRGYGLPRNPEPMPGMVIGFQEMPWQPRGYPDVSESGIRGGWDLPFVRLSLGRGFSGELIDWNMLPDYSVSAHSYRHGQVTAMGFSRVWGDSFRIPPDMRRLVHRSGWVNLLRNTRYTLAPGPEGALAKVKFQHIAEGVQAAEARIAIEKVLADEAKRDMLDDDLEKKARQAINWRIQFEREMRDGDWKDFDEAEFRDKLHKLYEAAGEVVAAGTSASP